MMRIPFWIAIGMVIGLVGSNMTARWGTPRGGQRAPAPVAPLPPAAPAPAGGGAAAPEPPPRRVTPSPSGQVEPAIAVEEARPAQPTVVTTAHGRLVLDGRFAERIGLQAALNAVWLPGKRVAHTPQDHLVTAFVNLVAGHRQLQAVSRGETALRPDQAVAHAWGQERFPDVSGVSRLLHATTWTTAAAVRQQLTRVFAPYVALCQDGTGWQTVDWDLTDKRITADAKSEPYAAFGHLGDRLEKGYQWAAAVLRGRGPDGQPRPVALGGFLRPGNTHPPACLEGLRQLTEAALGRPRRRPDLLAVRLTAARTFQLHRQARAAAAQRAVARQAAQLERLRQHEQRVQQRRDSRPLRHQKGRAQDERLLARLAERVRRAADRQQATQARLADRERLLAEAAAVGDEMEARMARFGAENEALDAANDAGARIEIVMDAQFGGSEQVATLLEEGYAVTTKAISPETAAGLLARAAQGEALFGPWTPVSANAEVADCRETRYAQCPHPVRLVGYRKHLAATEHRPAQTSHAVIVTSVPATERSAVETIADYHDRGGTIELVNRWVKATLGWRGHRLRQAPGLDIVCQFAFASVNFVSWLADTLWSAPAPAAGPRPGLTTLMQLARTPATVVSDEDGVVVEFAVAPTKSPRTLRFGVLRQPTLPGFVWPGVPVSPHFTAPG